MTRQWETLKEYDEIKYEFFEGIAKVTINRPEVRNAFTPKTVAWCKDIMKHSPTALRFLKAAMNADTDGLAGLQQMAGDATLLYYTTDEAKEGRDAFKEKRDPDFDQFPKFP